MQASTDWMRSTHIMESYLLYSKATDLNVNLIQKHCYRNIQNSVWLSWHIKLTITLGVCSRVPLETYLPCTDSPSTLQCRFPASSNSTAPSDFLATQRAMAMPSSKAWISALGVLPWTLLLSPKCSSCFLYLPLLYSYNYSLLANSSLLQSYYNCLKI